MAKQQKNKIENGVVIGAYSTGSVLVAVNGGSLQIICYDDNKKTDEVGGLKANDKVKIEISALDPNRGWILDKI
jgi:hypothetical protein